jgi:Uma2 family endonuclease
MTIATDRPIQRQDRLVILQGDWAHFQRIREGCEQTPKVKLSYFQGSIEILMPSRLHEIFSSTFHLLLSLYLAHVGIEFLATGSADQETEGEALAQPDQSYCLNSIKTIPDLSIEVVFSSGGINKLARYRAIGVPEVWFWEDGVLALYHLRPEGYEQIELSELPGLKNLDLVIFRRCLLMGETSTADAMREFNAYLAQLP